MKREIEPNDKSLILGCAILFDDGDKYAYHPILLAAE